MDSRSSFADFEWRLSIILSISWGGSWLGDVFSELGWSAVFYWNKLLMGIGCRSGSVDVLELLDDLVSIVWLGVNLFDLVEGLFVVSNLEFEAHRVLVLQHQENDFPVFLLFCSWHNLGIHDLQCLLWLVDVVNWSVIDVNNLSVADSDSHELVSILDNRVTVDWVSNSLSFVQPLVLRLSFVSELVCLNFSKVVILVHGWLSDRNDLFYNIPKDSFRAWNSSQGSWVSPSSVEL